MKFEALRRRVARWIEPAATSHTPQIDPRPDVMKMLAEAVGGPGAEAVPLAGGSFEIRKRPGIKPPAESAEPKWTWSQWQHTMQENGRFAGWAWCRFANRLGGDDIDFVFGHARGSFGVWQQPFRVCAQADPEQPWEDHQQVLTCITHLPTGVGIGLFQERALAIEASELAERVCPEWATLAEHNSTIYQRTQAAWIGVGIVGADNAHAHDEHGNAYVINGRSDATVMAGKPEKLS